MGHSEPHGPFLVPHWPFSVPHGLFLVPHGPFSVSSETDNFRLRVLSVQCDKMQRTCLPFMTLAGVNWAFTNDQYFAITKVILKFLNECHASHFQANELRSVSRRTTT